MGFSDGSCERSTLTAELPVLAEGDFYYEALGGGRFRSTIHAQGAWNEHEQHMAPASGIMAYALAGHEPREDMRMARLSYEILGLIPGGEFEVVTSTLRPGRTIELVQAGSDEAWGIAGVVQPGGSFQQIGVRAQNGRQAACPGGDALDVRPAARQGLLEERPGGPLRALPRA